MVDLEAYKSGERDALADAFTRCAPWVWALARRGFVCEDALTLGSERTLIRVLGTPSSQTAADLTESILAQSMRPEHRQAASAWEDVEQTVLDIARLELFRSGERNARLVSLNRPEAQLNVPTEVEDLDALLQLKQRPSLKGLPLTESQRHAIETGETETRDAVAQLDDRGRELVQRRFIDGQDLSAVANHFDCGTAAIALHEDRIRRRVRQRLRAALNTPTLGDADVDAFLGQTPSQLLPPGITWTRVRKRVLNRVHQTEPSPYRTRLAWGLGMMMIAAGAWAAMALGLLPSPDRDPLQSAQVVVRCSPACMPGAESTVAIQAPEGAKRFVVLLSATTTSAPSVIPFLSTSGGTSLRLPFGAQQRLLSVPTLVRIPPHLNEPTRAIALFSEQPFSTAQAIEHVLGHRRLPGIETATTSVLP